MRTYFFGDLHGNPNGLDVCLRRLEEEKPDEVYCLGDLAGWLPLGDKTFSRMRSAGFPTVAGNHDLLIAGAITDFADQVDRMQASAYNAGLLSREEGAVEYILSLPLTIEKQDFTIVHHSPFDLPAKGSPPTIECFGYLDTAALARAVPLWRNYSKRLIFSGHDHIPAVYELVEGGEVRVHRPIGREDLRLRLNQASRYWVKAGSVGGPYRDKTPVANSVLYDSDEQTITMFRIAFDTHPLSEALSSNRFCRNIPTIKRYIELLKSEE
ncbi:MAG TPA: metallophosphoesterase [Syntrophobacteraceae bacterium]|nr:metallophosphoesterase [Syntrophobacteraceae bacterium]